MDGSAALGLFFQRMRSLAPVPSAHHSTQRMYMPPSLRAATHVYVRYDAVCHPLQRPYDGPFLVLKSGKKTFTILRQGQQYVKPAVPLLPPAPASLPPSAPAPLLPSAPAPLPPPTLSARFRPPPRVQRLLDEDFPPLPPSKPYQTNYRRISKPPARFSL